VKALLAGILLCGLPTAAIAQVSSGGTSVRQAQDGSTTVRASGLFAFQDALTALNHSRGWVVDFEDSRAAVSRATSSRPAYRETEVPHIPALRDAGSGDEKRVLEEMLQDRNNTHPGERFRLVQTGPRRFDVVSVVPGMSALLDTETVLDSRKHSLEATVEAILQAVARERGCADKVRRNC
jgi:hypothetical protein